MSSKPNIYQLLQMRRRLKQYKTTGADDLKQILIQLKKYDLDEETLYDTQLPRTLVYLYNKLKDLPNDDPLKDIFKMVKFLYTKEWRPKFEKYLEAGKGKEKGKGKDETREGEGETVEQGKKQQ